MLSFLYCLHSEVQNNFSKKMYNPVGIEHETLGLLDLLCVHSHASLTQLTWQVIIEGYLTSVLLVHQLTFGLR